jgi:hypothetical protein
VPFAVIPPGLPVAPVHGRLVEAGPVDRLAELVAVPAQADRETAPHSPGALRANFTGSVVNHG